jgi:type IV pilus assembly protein PilN
MARINLLPWREERRKDQQKQFLSVLVLSVFLMALIIVAVHLQVARAIGVQKSRNDFLNKEIVKVEAQIKEINNIARERKRLQDRIDIIQQLQRNRPEIVHLFDEIARVLPDGVYLTKLTQKARSIDIEGVAQSNARVSAFMRNLDSSAWLADPTLSIIESEKKREATDGGRNFKLNVKQVTNVDETNNGR